MTRMNQPFGATRDMLNYESRADTITVAQFFNTVYAWMCVGLALTAVVGWFVAHSSLVNVIYASRGGYLLFGLCAFGIAWYVQSQAANLSVGVATLLFLVYASVIGA